MTTINAQIDRAQTAINAGDHAEAKILIEALLVRRANKAQNAEVEALVAALEAIAPTYKMSNQLAKYRARYQLSIAASGAKSLSNGDDLANFLEQKSAFEVCALADIYTPIKGGQLHMVRYAKLNEGQKRMNSGNKLRAAIKRGTIAVSEEQGICAV